MKIYIISCLACFGLIWIGVEMGSSMSAETQAAEAIPNDSGLVPSPASFVTIEEAPRTETCSCRG